MRTSAILALVVLVLSTGCGVKGPPVRSAGSVDAPAPVATEEQPEEEEE